MEMDLGGAAITALAVRPTTDQSFFQRKRTWSRIKDAVIGNYLPPYLRKIQTRPTPIELIDGCAGPGEYGDGTIGSPLIFAEAAERYAPGRYRACLVNQNAAQHEALQMAIARRGLDARVRAQRGGCQELLRERGAQLLRSDATVFVYLDPFGLRPLDMDSLADFFKRTRAVSTELLINLNTPEVVKLAARHQPGDQSRLTTALGGTWWRPLAEHRAPAASYAAGYCAELRRRGFLFAGSSPVFDGARLKYDLIFASNHVDGMVVMNDVMAGALDRHVPGTRAGDDLLRQLPELVVRGVLRTPGVERIQLWEEILVEHFARYMAKEFRAAVADLVRTGRLRFSSPTDRPNDHARLFAVA